MSNAVNPMFFPIPIRKAIFAVITKKINIAEHLTSFALRFQANKEFVAVRTVRIGSLTLLNAVCTKVRLTTLAQNLVFNDVIADFTLVFLCKLSLLQERIINF